MRGARDTGSVCPFDPSPRVSFPGSYIFISLPRSHRRRAAGTDRRSCVWAAVETGAVLRVFSCVDPLPPNGGTEL